MAYSQAATAHLAKLRAEHRDLDDNIDRLAHHINPEAMELNSLKRRRLRLKDTIVRLEGQLKG